MNINSNDKQLNLVPLLSPFYRKVGLAILLTVVLFFTLNTFFGFSIVSKEILLLVVNFSMLLLNFSLEKDNKKLQLIYLYHSLKFAFVFFNGFIISYYLVTNIFTIERILSSLDILMIMNILLTIHYNVLRLLKINYLVAEDNTLSENIKRQPFFYVVVCICAFLTLIAIIL